MRVSQSQREAVRRLVVMWVSRELMRDDVYEPSTKLRYKTIMGVYLSEPNKDKHFAEGTCNGYSFVSAEMQGT